MTDQLRVGRVFVSVGVKAVLSVAELASLLARHSARERIIATGSQLVSEFVSGVSHRQLRKIWVITEPSQMRTVLMLPRETPYRTDDIEFDRTDGVALEEIPALSQDGFRDSQSPRHFVAPKSLQRPEKPATAAGRHEREKRAPARRAIPNAPGMASPHATAGSHRRDSGYRGRDDAYWDETADLVLNYFELLAGPNCAALVEGFIDWLKRSHDARNRYLRGDDMDRAALVERYLKLRSLPRE